MENLLDLLAAHGHNIVLHLGPYPITGQPQYGSTHALLPGFLNEIIK